jgi:hypothetical protein
MINFMSSSALSPRERVWIYGLDSALSLIASWPARNAIRTVKDELLHPLPCHLTRPWKRFLCQNRRCGAVERGGGMSTANWYRISIQIDWLYFACLPACSICELEQFFCSSFLVSKAEIYFVCRSRQKVITQINSTRTFPLYAYFDTLKSISSSLQKPSMSSSLMNINTHISLYLSILR